MTAHTPSDTLLALLDDCVALHARITAHISALPAGQLRAWAQQNATVIEKSLRAGINEPAFILSSLYGIAQLSTDTTFDGDPISWFADHAGYSLKETNQYLETARWLHQPSRFPLPPHEEELIPAQRAAIATKRQTTLRELLNKRHVSLRGIQTLIQNITFLKTPIKHLAPQLIESVLAESPNYPSVTQLHHDIHRLVAHANDQYGKRKPPIDRNQLRFSRPDARGMVTITAHVNADYANNIRKAIRQHLKTHDNPAKHPAARDFQALYQLIMRRSANTTTAPLNYDIGVVLTLDDVERIQKNHETTVRTASGININWDEIQRDRSALLDWIAIIDTHGIQIKRRTSSRFATYDQRLATSLRSPYCAYPGCTVRANNAQAHHVKAWADGGETSAENLAFLCERHHPLNDDTRQKPGRFHVELDADYIPVIIYHPKPGQTQREAEYNELNLQHAAALRAKQRAAANPDPEPAPTATPQP